MTVMYVDTEDFPKKLGKFPDYLVKGLGKPSIIGGKIRGAVQLGKILYKTGAWKRVGRYYGYKYRKRITAGVTGGIIIGNLSSIPFQGPEQARTYMVKSSTRRKYSNRYHSRERCKICRC